LSYIFIFRKQFYFGISGLKIIGHGNPDNNLESICMSTVGLKDEVSAVGVFRHPSSRTEKNRKIHPHRRNTAV